MKRPSSTEAPGYSIDGDQEEKSETDGSEGEQGRQCGALSAPDAGSGRLDHGTQVSVRLFRRVLTPVLKVKSAVGYEARFCRRKD